MKKRKLIVENAEKALKSMLSMLEANMIDNDLDSSSMKLVWLERGDNDLVGCPCFACNFHGVVPSGERIDAIVYVKTFASRTFNMCKMHILKEKAEIKYCEIVNGETFTMDSKGYDKENYLYKDGTISLVR